LLDVQARRAAAQTLWRLSADGGRLPELPAGQRPADLAEGWAIQRALDALEGRRVGWKVASVSPAAQQRFGVGEPLIGAMYERNIVPNHAIVPATLIGLVEAEFAFRMSADVGPERAPFTMEDVLESVAAVYGGVEAPDTRLANYPHISTPQVVADFMLGRFYALGDPLGIPPSELRDVQVVIRRNGAEASRGSGRDLQGDPCNILLWLARELVRRGEHLRAGDLVTTGACALVNGVTAGDTVTATFAGSAEAGLSFAAGPDGSGRG
jgi:2-keto-4-pentenoate hydratase